MNPKNYNNIPHIEETDLDKNIARYRTLLEQNIIPCVMLDGSIIYDIGEEDGI